MAKKTISRVEQHVEKAVLGITALAFVSCAAWFLVAGAPYRASGWNGDEVRPADLPAALEAQARQAADKWRALGPPPPPSANTNKVDATPDVFGLLKQYPDLKAELFSPLSKSPPLVEGERASRAARRSLVRVVAPSRPLTAVHRNVLSLPSEITLDALSQKDNMGEGTPWGDSASGSYWVMCGGVLDLAAQEAAFTAAGYPPNQMDLTIYDVQLQRRRVVQTDAGDDYGAWTDVETWLPYARPPIPAPAFAADGACAPKERADLESLWSLLRRGQRWILRPDLPKQTKGQRVNDPIIPWLRLEPKGWFDPQQPKAPEIPDVKRDAKLWVREAEAARGAKPPDFDRAYLLAEAAYWASGVSAADREKSYAKLLDELDARFSAQGGTPPKRELRRRMPFVTYDLSVQPGAFYQYRTRLRALNRFAGRPSELGDPADCKKVLIPGEWSPPGALLEVPSDLYMYLVRANESRGEAVVEVFRKVGRDYESKRYTVTQGDSIGKEEKKGRGTVDFRTKSMVVDIDFKYLYRPPGGASEGVEPTTALVCTDPDEPAGLRELVLARDEKDLKRRSLGGK